MSETLRKTATIEFEYGLATTCEDRNCRRSSPLHVFVVTGDAGRDGVAVYCPRHAQVREARNDHTHIGEVEQ